MAAERVLAPIASLREAREIILHSAGRFDAVASPGIIDRAGIPVESWILAACEEFVRFIHGKPEDPEGVRKALKEIQEGAAKRHDPEVVAALSRVLEKQGLG
jgi:response regulator RpfG family c-di-GMP phosphodiesterase